MDSDKPNITWLRLEKVFEKGILLFLGGIALLSIFLLMLFIYYFSFLLISSRDIFFQLQGFF
tara:strand:- start:281 stop:466 length:186 start_codon:yes stop_codon:yes gene_type:complete